jgi:hypothetical protein
VPPKDFGHHRFSRSTVMLKRRPRGPSRHRAPNARWRAPYALKACGGSHRLAGAAFADQDIADNLQHDEHPLERSDDLVVDFSPMPHMLPPPLGSVNEGAESVNALTAGSLGRPVEWGAAGC